MSDAKLALAPPSLSRLSILGASWSMVGYGASQVLRLGSNLLLTRLLAPEYFGLMALINVLMIGLNMFSDLGLGPNIVQSRRGDDPRFLNTAWTVQFLRGCAIWLCAIVGAWPFAKFYEDPRLLGLVPVVGFSAVITGLNSMKVFSAQRHIDYARLTMIDLASQAASVTLMIGWAAWQPSVWALVGGWLFGNLVKTVATHVAMPGAPDRFSWDRTSVHELIGFGKWIFLSTVLSFAANSAGSLILGKLVSMTEVGIFAIAVTLAKGVEQAFETISSRVLLPVFARIKEMPIADVRSRLMRVRLAVMATFLPPLWGLAIFGRQVIELLFDPRYHGGGWILQIYAISAMPGIISGIGQFYLAKGNSFLVMALSAIRLITYLTAIYIGWVFGGGNGVIAGMALFTVPLYFLDMLFQRRYGIFMPWLDAVAVATTAVTVGIGLALTQPWPH